MKKPELLAPAGNFEKLKTALHYGADAIYMGLSDFSLRAKAGNFTIPEFSNAVDYTRAKGGRVYVTINIFPHNRDILPVKEHISLLRDIAPDGIVLSDPGVFEMVMDGAPDIPIHISTQANITNYRSALFWERLGAKRLILSRELSINEIREIRENLSIELECFVHGSICISYSGRCYISSFLTNRSANRGECTNSCRWRYTLCEEKRPGEYFPLYEDDRGTYIMSSRDLCMLGYLDLLVDAGIDSFKIEGRMKGINYLAGVVKTYREAIDSIGSHSYAVKEEWLKELLMFSGRGFTTGMFLGNQPENDYNHDEENVYRMTHELVGIVESVNNGSGLVALRNTIKPGDFVEFLSQGQRNEPYEITRLFDTEGGRVESGRNEESIIMNIPRGVRENDIIRRKLK